MALTTGKMGMKDKKKPAAAGKSKKGPPIKKFVDRLILPFVPENASMAGYRDKDGNEKTVKLKKRAYVIPKSIKGAERHALIRELQKAGFVHERIVDKPPAKQKYRVRYLHPDNEPGYPKKEGEVKIMIEEIEHVLTLDPEGTVFAEDADLQDYLAGQGWVEVARIPIEE